MSEEYFTAAYNRIREVTGCRTQVEVSEFLDIRQSSISDAKKRGNIPGEWLITLLEKNSINPLWIKTGRGDRYVALSPNAPESARARIVLHHLCGPLPPQGLVNALAKVFCGPCPNCSTDKRPICYAAFASQALAVCEYMRTLIASSTEKKEVDNDCSH